jgi:hypothetical protein
MYGHLWDRTKWSLNTGGHKDRFPCTVKILTLVLGFRESTVRGSTFWGSNYKQVSMWCM